MDQTSEGLRNRQRKIRRIQMLQAAAALFTENGFDATTVEDVARKAMVSAPTVYSYFQTKDGLLLAIFQADEALVEPHVKSILDDPPEDAFEVVLAVELAIITCGYDVAHKRVWREISAAALRGQAEQRDQYAQVQERRLILLAKAVEMLKNRGQLRADLNPQSAARVIHAVGRNAFRRYIGIEDADTSELETRIRTDLATIFEGLKA